MQARDSWSEYQKLNEVVNVKDTCLFETTNQIEATNDLVKGQGAKEVEKTLNSTRPSKESRMVSMETQNRFKELATPIGGRYGRH